MSKNYNEEAAALVWEIINDKKDIGKWILTYKGKEIKGKGFKEFHTNAAKLSDDINVVFVKNLNCLVYLLEGSFDFNNKKFFGNGDRDFFYIEIDDNLELRNWDKFEAKVEDGKEFIQRLDFMRNCFKGDKDKSKKKLSLKTYFRFTKAHDMWEDIKYRYYLRSTWNQRFCEELCPRTEDEYEVLFSLNKAGFYYANKDYEGKVVQKLHSYDISSSHIGFMARELYPSSHFEREDNPKKIERILKDENKCWYGLFGFKNLRYRYPNFEINSGFWIVLNVEKDWSEVFLTNVDSKWFKKMFVWDQCVVADDFWWAEQALLPKEYRSMVDSLYRIKDGQKKDTYPKEICKFRAELPFGQSIKKVEYLDELIYNEKENKFEVVEAKEIGFEAVQNKILKRKIPVQIGMWTVAYSRLELISIILEIGLENVVYGDTDCVRFVGDEGVKIIENRNKEIDLQVKRSYENSTCQIIHEKMGKWCDEGDLAAFKSIGIKWYITLDMEGNYDVKCAGGNSSAIKDCFNKWKFPLYEFGYKMKVEKLFKSITYSKKEKGALVLSYTNKIGHEEIDSMKKLSRKLCLPVDKEE